MVSTRIVLAFLLTASILLSAPLVAAQDEPPLADPVVAKLDQRVMRFLEAVAAGKQSDAFADLLLGSQLVEQESAVRALVDKSKEIPQRYGAYRASEQLSAKRIGKDLVLLKYLFKCEKFPVVWYVAFYRDLSRQASGTDDYWVVISVRFDTQIEQLFE